MTVSAWVMLGLTWSVIVFFTLRFFGRVLRSRSSVEAPGGAPGDEPVSRPGAPGRS